MQKEYAIQFYKTMNKLLCNLSFAGQYRINSLRSIFWYSGIFIIATVISLLRVHIAYNSFFFCQNHSCFKPCIHLFGLSIVLRREWYDNNENVFFVFPLLHEINNTNICNCDRTFCIKTVIACQIKCNIKNTMVDSRKQTSKSIPTQFAAANHSILSRKHFYTFFVVTNILWKYRWSVVILVGMQNWVQFVKNWPTKFQSYTKHSFAILILLSRWKWCFPWICCFS